MKKLPCRRRARVPAVLFMDLPDEIRLTGDILKRRTDTVIHEGNRAKDRLAYNRKSRSALSNSAGRCCRAVVTEWAGDRERRYFRYCEECRIFLADAEGQRLRYQGTAHGG